MNARLLYVDALSLWIISESRVNNFNFFNVPSWNIFGEMKLSITIKYNILSFYFSVLKHQHDFIRDFGFIKCIAMLTHHYFPIINTCPSFTVIIITWGCNYHNLICDINCTAKIYLLWNVHIQVTINRNNYFWILISVAQLCMLFGPYVYLLRFPGYSRYNMDVFWCGHTNSV